MDASSIIKSVCEHYKLTISQLATRLGYNRPQGLYDIVNGKVKRISNDLTERLCLEFPELNKVWLLSGEGEMIHNTSTKIPNNIITLSFYSTATHSEKDFLLVGNRVAEVARLKGIDIEKLAEIINVNYKKLKEITEKTHSITDALIIKILKAFPDINPVWLTTGSSTPLINKIIPPIKDIPLSKDTIEKEKQLAEKDGTIELQKTTISALNEAKDLLKKQIETMEKEMAELNHQLLLMQKNSVPTKTTDAPNTFQTLG